jgi:hypothetical protein
MEKNIFPTDEQVAHIVAMGYAIHITHLDDYYPAIRCATDEGNIHSAPSWDALTHYARGYELCACGVHEQAFYDEKDR